MTQTGQKSAVIKTARVAKLVDAPGLGPDAFMRVGSSPAARTTESFRGNAGRIFSFPVQKKQPALSNTADNRHCSPAATT